MVDLRDVATVVQIGIHDMAHGTRQIVNNVFKRCNVIDLFMFLCIAKLTAEAFPL